MSPPPRIPAVVWSVALLVTVALLAFGWRQLEIARRPPPPPLPIWANSPDFSFQSQTGATVTRGDLSGKIWIANFIFTRCAGPCPVMTERLAEVQRALGAGNDDVRLVSVSVDPEFDRPEVLAKYAARFGADPARWLFLTGDPATVQKYVTKGMLLPLAKDGEGAPIHSQKFLVLDGRGQIRAFRDLDLPNLVPQLLQDVESLRHEKSAPAAPAQP